MNARFLIALLSLAAGPLLVSPVHAQDAAPDAGSEKVKQVIVYGDDPCPTSAGSEITVCARLAESERYRIPKELRTDPNDPKVQSWMNRAQSIEYVGREGTDSCSPTGIGGFTGCFQKMARAARAERRSMMGDASWADQVSAERQKRLSGLDAESEAVEKRVKAEEAAEAAKTPAPPAN